MKIIPNASGMKCYFGGSGNYTKVFCLDIDE
jgi:hypothetical protein